MYTIKTVMNFFSHFIIKFFNNCDKKYFRSDHVDFSGLGDDCHVYQCKQYMQVCSTSARYSTISSFTRAENHVAGNFRVLVSCILCRRYGITL